MISKKYLLSLAGIVWSIAGYNVLHIGLQSYTEYLSPILFFASSIVFLFFQFMIFGKLVKKHTKRIKSYQEEKKWFWNFFDLKSFLIMAFMITGGILIRSLGLCPEWFIAFFYTGLGTSLFLAGLTFFYQFFHLRTTI